MRIAKVIGTLTLHKALPEFQGASLKVVRPLTLANLLEESDDELDELVTWDQLGSGQQSLVALAEGPEAAQPFRPEVKPIDAYISAILDDLNIGPIPKDVRPSNIS